MSPLKAVVFSVGGILIAGYVGARAIAAVEVKNLQQNLPLNVKPPLGPSRQLSPGAASIGGVLVADPNNQNAIQAASSSAMQGLAASVGYRNPPASGFSS